MLPWYRVRLKRRRELEPKRPAASAAAKTLARKESDRPAGAHRPAGSRRGKLPHFPPAATSNGRPPGLDGRGPRRPSSPSSSCSGASSIIWQQNERRYEWRYRRETAAAIVFRPSTSCATIGRPCPSACIVLVSRSGPKEAPAGPIDARSADQPAHY